MNPFENFSHAQLFPMDDSTLEKMLLEAWEMKELGKLEVFGKLERLKDPKVGNWFLILTDIADPWTGKELDYPIEKVESFKDKSPFISATTSQKFLETDILFVKCELQLSNRIHRIQHKNPLLLNVVEGSLEEYMPLEVMHRYTAWKEQEFTFISKTIYEHYLNRVKNNNRSYIEELIEQNKKQAEAIETEFIEKSKALDAKYEKKRAL